MSRITAALVGLALAGLSLIAAPVAAQAADTGSSAPAAPASATGTGGAVTPGGGADRGGRIAAADGYFYAYLNINYNNWGGYSCRWSNNSPDWGACRNTTSSVLNNGYTHTYDDVLMFWDDWYGGASYCVARGRGMGGLGFYTFDRWPGYAGYGETLDNNVSSHTWVHNTTC